jgi:hypothetical protein
VVLVLQTVVGRTPVIVCLVGLAKTVTNKVGATSFVAEGFSLHILFTEVFVG